jgi:hypothetical protein
MSAPGQSPPALSLGTIAGRLGAVGQPQRGVELSSMVVRRKNRIFWKCVRIEMNENGSDVESLSPWSLFLSCHTCSANQDGRSKACSSPAARSNCTIAQLRSSRFSAPSSRRADPQRYVNRVQAQSSCALGRYCNADLLILVQPWMPEQLRLMSP